jgi:hypothetical protein
MLRPAARAGEAAAGLVVGDDGALSYSIDAVLRAWPNGTVHIGLDLGGGSPSSTFTARVLERAGATVLTTTVNSGASFGSFVASRGLVALHVIAAHRLPLFDGSMDIVHAGHELGGGGRWMAQGVQGAQTRNLVLAGPFELRRRAAERDVRAPAGSRQ